MRNKILSLVAVISGLFICSVGCYAADISSVTAKSWSNYFEYFAECPVSVGVCIFSIIAVIIFAIFCRPLAKKLNGTNSSKMIGAFIAILAVSGAGMFITSLISDGTAFGHLLHSENTDPGATFHFFDYLNSLRNAGSKNFELMAEEYSPASMLIFYVIAQFMPNKYISSTGIAALIKMSREQTFVYCYLIIITFIILFINKFNNEILRANGNKTKNEIFTFLLIITYPTLYCIKLGNIIGLSFTFLMAFIAFYNSEKRTNREIALVALGISAAITPYTIVFALLLLTKKKDSVYQLAKALLYSVILFMAPAFFTGFGNMLEYIKHLFVTPSSISIENIAVSGILRFIGIESDAVIYVIGTIFALVALACIFILPATWQKTAAAVYFIIDIVPSAPNAILLFVFIPFVLMLAEKSHKAIDWMYFAAFSLLVLPIPEWFMADGDAFHSMFESIGVYVVHNANELIAPFAIQLIFVLCVCQAVSALKADKKQKNISTE